MSTRPLSTLPLAQTILSTLARGGYETEQDLSTLTPETLSKGTPSSFLLYDDIADTRHGRRFEHPPLLFTGCLFIYSDTECRSDDSISSVHCRCY